MQASMRSYHGSSTSLVETKPWMFLNQVTPLIVADKIFPVSQRNPFNAAPLQVDVFEHVGRRKRSRVLHMYSLYHVSSTRVWMRHNIESPVQSSESLVLSVSVCLAVRRPCRLYVMLDHYCMLSRNRHFLSFHEASSSCESPNRSNRSRWGQGMVSSTKPCLSPAMHTHD